MSNLTINTIQSLDISAVSFPVGKLINGITTNDTSVPTYDIISTSYSINEGGDIIASSSEK